ncbi:CBS domain-containing protein [Amylibacter sp. SFDW26]|uniref:site-2 protease family protein n=1 Tax=Amylibacter sp. SFDW26 TaxID=2652722 RepID=UPI0012615A7E|nr:site-2 protease family protein [Amylibacter sp. SFDW26]KAB7614441.1 CBS domain-containing protein [Amylibacter sp. SFDW26]
MFKNAFNLIEVFGFKIRVDPSWFLIAALMVWSLTITYFPETLPEQSRLDYFALSIAATIGAFVSLLIHELSHSLVARTYNINVTNITLFIFGGVAELEKEVTTPAAEFWIAIVGPVSSFILAGLFYTLGHINISLNASDPLIELLKYLTFINLVIAVFNLVPAFPLDGGRILRSLLWKRSGNYIGATYVASLAGQVFSVFLIITGMLAIFTGFGSGGLWQVLIGFFIFMASRSSYAQVLMREALKEKTISNLMSQVIHTADVADTIDALVEDVILRYGVSFVPVTEGDMLLGYIDKNVIHKIDTDNWATSKVGDVYITSTPQNTVSSATSLPELIDIMSKENQRKMLVSDNGILLGVITLADMMDYVSLRNKLVMH